MQQFDVCVVGAGIAGSTLASELSQLGYKVALIEKDDFPRFHIGCSFSAGVVTHWISHFKLNNILREAIIHQKQKVEVCWENHESILKDEKGCLVDRALFDNLLLRKCVENGVEIFTSNKSLSLLNKDKNGWIISLNNTTVLCKFLVEATGRKSSIIKTGKKKYLPKLLAVYSFLNEEIEHPIIKSGIDYWIWKTPYKNNLLAVIYTDPKTINENGGMQEFYQNTLKNEFGYMLDSTSISKITICDATANVDLSPIGSNYIKIGDAAFTLDPISSQGVAKAFKNVSYAIRVINTIIKKPQLLNDVINFYLMAINDEVEDNKKWTSDFYQLQSQFNSAFWKQYHSFNHKIENSILTLNLDRKSVV